MKNWTRASLRRYETNRLLWIQRLQDHRWDNETSSEGFKTCLEGDGWKFS
jgi:hypothetical protein